MHNSGVAQHGRGKAVGQNLRILFGEAKHPTEVFSKANWLGVHGGTWGFERSLLGLSKDLRV